MDYLYQMGRLVSNVAPISSDDAVQQIEVPADIQKGDLAFPCFRLAKEMKKAPNVIAEEIAEKINAS